MKSTTFLFFAFALVLFCLTSSPLVAGIQDSIGVEKKDGKVYVLHQVDAKETLFSISRRYSAKVDEIKQANPDIGDGLKIGQTIKVPYKGVLVASFDAVTEPSLAKGVYIEHTVEGKETLYSISKKYNVSVDEITKVNPGIEKGLSVGQVLKIYTTAPPKVETTLVKGTKLHTVESKETLFGIAKKYNVSVDELKKANPTLIEGLKVGTELIIPSKGEIKPVNTPTKPIQTQTPPVKEDRIQPSTTNASTSKSDYKKVSENGLAELMENRSDAPKFHALHKTAPIGTIIQVINQTNGEKIFVRVIGKLTEMSDPKVIIKISKKALERLNSSEKIINVDLTYIP